MTRSTSQFLFAGPRLGKLARRIFNEEFFDCLFGSLFLGGILWGACWWCSSEGAQHPYLSALLFGTFALPFSINDMVDDLLAKRFGTHSWPHIIVGGASCLLVFLGLAMAFVTFFCATITFATVATVFAVVAGVILLLYFLMAINGYF